MNCSSSILTRSDVTKFSRSGVMMQGQEGLAWGRRGDVLAECCCLSKSSLVVIGNVRSVDAYHKLRIVMQEMLQAEGSYKLVGSGLDKLRNKPMHAVTLSNEEDASSSCCWSLDK
jgi:hypothetical protein